MLSAKQSFDAGARSPGDPTEPLLLLSDARTLLHVQDADHDLDDQMSEYLAMATVRVETELRPFADASPPVPGTRTFQAARDCARYLFLSMWYRDHSLVELGRAQGEQYKEAMAALKKSITADKPERRESFLVTRDESAAVPTFEPGAADMYLTREFL